MNVKLKQRSNGDVTKPAWEVADEADQALMDKLAGESESMPTDDEIPTLPPMKRPKPHIQAKEPSKEPPRQPQRTVDAREIIETIVMAYMATDEDRVSIEVVGSDILIEQIIKTDGHMVKHRWAIGISRYVTSSRKLIK